MSRKHSTHSHHRPAHPAQDAPSISSQELESRWNSLHLHPQTKDHLEHMLQADGLGLALAATIALDLEMQREEQTIRRSVWGWITDELRMSFLEEGCQHIVETGRLIIDVSLTWTVVQGPRYLATFLLVLGVLLMFCCSLFVYHHRRAFRRSHGK